MLYFLSRKSNTLVILAFISMTGWAANQPVVCDAEEFNSRYFFIEIDDVAQVSVFFQQIPALYFDKSNEYFAISVGGKDRLEVYFDDMNFMLLNNNQELLLNQNMHLPGYRTDREQVVLRNLQSKVNKNNYFEVKNYNKKATPLDKHELFGRVKRKQRQELIEKLSASIHNPVEELEEKLRVKHQEIVQLYTHYGKGHGEITWDKFHVSNFGMSNTYSLFKFEIYADLFSQLNPTEKRFLSQFYCNTYSAFRKEFPDIHENSRFGYSAYHQLAESLFPGRLFFEKYPVLFSLGQIVILGIVGFLFITLFVGRYTKRQHYRSVSVNTREKKHDS